VGALINIFRRVGPIELRRHIDEASLGLITPADILEYEDVSGALECLRLRQPSTVMVLAVWTDVVRRARDEERIRMRRVFGHIDRGKKMNTVAHRNPIFVLGVVRLNIKRLRLPLLRENGEYQQRNKQQNG